MKFSFTNHAKERMLMRNISAELVKSVIKNPKAKEYQNGQIVVKGVALHHTLRVVYRYEKGLYIIITAYYED